jgi:hypothetical protein
MSGIFKNHKKEKAGDSPRGAPGPHSSTNWGDDEYAAVVEGVKKIYKTKVKPLEVTYNFEGKQVKKKKKKKKNWLNLVI